MKITNSKKVKKQYKRNVLSKKQTLWINGLASTHEDLGIIHGTEMGTMVLELSNTYANEMDTVVFLLGVPC